MASERLASGATATLTLEGTVDAGQGGNTITNITTAATGDQVDPSTAGDDLEESVVVEEEVVVAVEPAIGLAKGASDAVVNGDNYDVTFTLVWQNIGDTALDNVQLFDDVAGLFGPQFVGIVPGSVAITNFAGSGNAPSVNTAFEGDTTQSLITANGPLAIGDAFEVVFTVTVDPDAAASFDGLVNQATSTGDAVDGSGAPILDASGTQLSAFDDSDNGSDTLGENGEDDGDGTVANDVTPIFIADLGIAKSLESEPRVQPSGNSLVTFEVVIGNTGTVDLAGLSLLEDLAGQFGDAYIGAGGLTLESGPSDPSSNILLNSAFNGADQTELLDQSISNTLAVGDSFTVLFTVEVDPDGTDGSLSNQVVGYGDAIDGDGNQIFDSNGEVLKASDFSDSGTSFSDTNAGAADDAGTSDDPTLFTPAPRVVDVIDGDVDDGLTSGSPARLPAPALIGFPRLSNQISSFLGGPGLIYSGIPINSNGNPLTLATNRPVTGGFSSQFAPAGPGIGDPAFADACDPCADAAMAQPDQFVGQDAVVYDQSMAVPNEVIGDYQYAPEMVQEVVEEGCQTCAEPIPCEACNSCGNCCGCDAEQKGVLFRIRNWLHR